MIGQDPISHGDLDVLLEVIIQRIMLKRLNPNDVLITVPMSFYVLSLLCPLLILLLHFHLLAVGGDDRLLAATLEGAHKVDGVPDALLPLAGNLQQRRVSHL